MLAVGGEMRIRIIHLVVKQAIYITCVKTCSKVGSVAQWLGRQSLAGGLSLTYA